MILIKWIPIFLCEISHAHISLPEENDLMYPALWLRIWAIFSEDSLETEEPPRHVGDTQQPVIVSSLRTIRSKNFTETKRFVCFALML